MIGLLPVGILFPNFCVGVDYPSRIDIVERISLRSMSGLGRGNAAELWSIRDYSRYRTNIIFSSI